MLKHFMLKAAFTCPHTYLYSPLLVYRDTHWFVRSLDSPFSITHTPIDVSGAMWGSVSFQRTLCHTDCEARNRPPPTFRLPDICSASRATAEGRRC